MKDDLSFASLPNPLSRHTWTPSKVQWLIRSFVSPCWRSCNSEIANASKISISQNCEQRAGKQHFTFGLGSSAGFLYCKIDRQLKLFCAVPVRVQNVSLTNFAKQKRIKTKRPISKWQISSQKEHHLSILSIATFAVLTWPLLCLSFEPKFAFFQKFFCQIFHMNNAPKRRGLTFSQNGSRKLSAAGSCFCM